jgi:predicted DNA-binding protein YlxM (UPF0122 family)
MKIEKLEIPDRKSKEYRDWLEYQLLKGGMSLKKIAEIYGVSRQRIHQEVVKFGIDLSKRMPEWYAKRYGKEELKSKEWFLKEKAKGRNLNQISKEIGVPRYILERQIQRLGLDPRGFNRKRSVIVRCNFCGKEFKRFLSTVKTKKYIFCSKEHFKKGAFKIVKNPWSKKEEEFILKNWQRMRDIEIAEKLNRSVCGVIMKRIRLGIKRT